MAVAIITKGTKISTIQFFRTFFVQEDPHTGKYFWDADSQRSGIIRLWIQRADTDPRIAFVLPTWQVTLNGVDLEQKFYEDINNLKGKEIRLRYGELSFTFQFCD